MEERVPILVVDDEPRNIKIVHEILEDEYELYDACNGEEALDLLKSFTPAVVILDIMMPGISGLEVCKVIKEDPKFQFTKVILVSGKARLEEKLEGYQAGTDDYMTKPFESEELEAKIRVFSQAFFAETQLDLLNRNLRDQIRTQAEELFESRKLAVIGTNSAHIIHNLKNPITTILAVAQFMREREGESKNLQRILKAVEKLRDIVTTVLDYSRNADENYGDVDLNDVLQDEANLLSVNERSRGKISVEMDLARDLPPIHGRAIDFSQVLSNLIQNAIDAMYLSEEGELSVSSKSDGKNVSLIIRDSGEGIPAENLPRIFDQKFTTKAKHRTHDEPVGSGLGLPFCKKMIESYGGRIEVKSTPGQGTEFVITLPCHSEGLRSDKVA